MKAPNRAEKFEKRTIFPTFGQDSPRTTVILNFSVPPAPPLLPLRVSPSTRMILSWTRPPKPPLPARTSSLQVLFASVHQRFSPPTRTVPPHPEAIPSTCPPSAGTSSCSPSAPETVTVAASRSSSHPPRQKVSGRQEAEVTIPRLQPRF